MAILMEIMLPVHTISLPVFDCEVLSQQVGVQCQVEEELGSMGRDFVENLLLRWLVGQGAQTAPRALLQLAPHVKGEEVPVLVHLDGECNFIVIEAGKELLWGGKAKRRNDILPRVIAKQPTVSAQSHSQGRIPTLGILSRSHCACSSLTPTSCKQNMHQQDKSSVLSPLQPSRTFQMLVASE